MTEQERIPSSMYRTIILPPEHEKEIAETLKRITLYRVAIHFHNVAKKTNDESAITQINNIRENILTKSIPYNPLFSEVEAMQKGSDKYKKIPIFGNATVEQEGNSTKTHELQTIDDILQIINPTSAVLRHALCLDNRYLRCSRVKREKVTQPIPPPSIGYIQTWTTHHAQIVQIIDNVQQTYGTQPQETIRIGNNTPLAHFKTGIDLENGTYIDPIYERFLTRMQIGRQ